ncbi:MAG: GntR family transcriptional regulator [Verrucomicrobiales bacterium]|nr:GntR family transcriptional regulator [Verrucomicrobiales bacterium]
MSTDASRLNRMPVYHQLNDRLLELLRGGGYGPGDRFLTEREVAARFGLSRITANKALSGLVAAGHLEFRKGVGSFVRGEALENDLRALVSFTHKAARSGRKPSTRVLACRRLAAGEADVSVRRELDVRDAEVLVYVERLRLADGEPVIFERRHLVAERCGNPGRRDLGSSFYEWLDRVGVRVTGAEQRIRAVAVPPSERRLLQLREGVAVLRVHAVGRAAAPLWVEDTDYRGDRYEFHNVLTDGVPPRPARATLLQPDTDAHLHA